MNFHRIFLAALSLALALAKPPLQKISLKVNLGGGPVADFLGEDQVLDMSAFSKNLARIPVQNTDQPEIFQTQRFAREADFTIRLPVPDGIYSVTLLFAETFRPACVLAARVFDISLGTPVSGVTKRVDAFDVFEAAGCAAAHGKRFDSVPSKGGIIVHLSRHAQHPTLAAFIVEGFPLSNPNASQNTLASMKSSEPQTLPATADPTSSLSHDTLAASVRSAEEPKPMGAHPGKSAPHSLAREAMAASHRMPTLAS